MNDDHSLNLNYSTQLTIYIKCTTYDIFKSSYCFSNVYHKNSRHVYIREYAMTKIC